MYNIKLLDNKNEVKFALCYGILETWKMSKSFKYNGYKVLRIDKIK